MPHISETANAENHRRNLLLDDIDYITNSTTRDDTSKVLEIMKLIKEFKAKDKS